MKMSDREPHGLAPAMHRPLTPANGMKRLQPQKILLLEDDKKFNATVKEYLQSHSYDVVSVENGAEGVRKVLADDFAVILCDMMMPTLSGPMFYRAIERAKPHLCNRFI